MPASRSRSPSCIAAVTAIALFVSGCAGLDSPGTMSHVDLESPAMQQFAVANMTDIERDVRLETGTRRNEKLTPTLFWTGIGVGTVGAVGGVVFGVLGFMAKNQLNDAYASGTGLTVDEATKLREDGATYNTLAKTFSAVAALGYALAIVTYGVDWNRCGPLVEKKRHCLSRERRKD
jgi:hypothetical protein